MALHRFRPAPLAPLLLALATGACGDAAGPANGSAAREPAGASTGFAGKLQPGLYDVVQTGDVEDHDTECITAAQLAKGQLAPDDSLQEGWRFVRNSMSGGRYAFEAAGPANARIISDGTYTATTYDGDFAMHYDQGGKPQTIRIKIKAKRIGGDCEAE